MSRRRAAGRSDMSERSLNYPGAPVRLRPGVTPSPLRKPEPSRAFERMTVMLIGLAFVFVAVQVVMHLTAAPAL